MVGLGDQGEPKDKGKMGPVLRGTAQKIGKHGVNGEEWGGGVRITLE